MPVLKPRVCTFVVCLYTAAGPSYIMSEGLIETWQSNAYNVSATVHTRKRNTEENLC